MTTYDSDHERRIAPIMEALGFIRYTGFFKLTFKDKAGKPFRAKPDWYNPALDLYAETKSHTLNSKTTQETAQNAERSQRRFREMKGQLFDEFDMLQTQWSHSKFKQAIVQQAHTPQKMIVVFDKPIPFKDMKAYKKAGLVAINLDSLKSYLGYVRLGQLGLHLQFSYDYYAENLSFVL